MHCPGLAAHILPFIKKGVLIIPQAQYVHSHLCNFVHVFPLPGIPSLTHLSPTSSSKPTLLSLKGKLPILRVETGHPYILGTPPSTLHMLVMKYWEPVPRGPVLWEARAEPWATWVPLLCFVLHVISWLLIFSILLVFDYAELMGLKQVYYHVLGLGEPLALKSPRALRLFSHLRHPVCVELLTVLWVVPTLGTDRLLLALLLTLYLGLAHGLDQHDLRYLRAQLQRKLHLLSRPQDGEAE
ncbi:nurim isoform 2-T2 [Dugong dugon]